MAHEILTQKEQLFCELYVNGTATYSGNAAKCYTEVFKDNDNLVGHKAKCLMARPEVREYIDDLQKIAQEETEDVKQFLTANLKSIVSESAHAIYTDKRGRDLSPAPLRSVAVAASKALMDLYPVRDKSSSILGNLEEAAGITFNVVVPTAPVTPAEDEKN